MAFRDRNDAFDFNVLLTLLSLLLSLLSLLLFINYFLFIGLSARIYLEVSASAIQIIARSKACRLHFPKGLED
jgi:hypothetical protein